MIPNTPFSFVPQQPLAPFTKDPAAAPLPSAGQWATQPHPAPVQQTLNTPQPQPQPSGPPMVDPATMPHPVQGTGAPVAGPGPLSPHPAAPQGFPPGATLPVSIPVMPPQPPLPRPAASPTPAWPMHPPGVAPFANGGTSDTTPQTLPPAVMTQPSGPRVPAPVMPPFPTQPPRPAVVTTPPTAVQSVPDLGPLGDLAGTWTGTGFNVIWRPNNSSGSDHFLELNTTRETLVFVEISGDIPNRGLLQGDISMRGLHYLQQIQDGNTNQGLHIEPGIWAFVPSTVNPLEPETVVRMASIPHGTSMLAQGTITRLGGSPAIPPVSIAPFVIAVPNQSLSFPETNLGTASAFRSPSPQLTGITQAMVDNPNSFLVQGLAGQTIRSTTRFDISSGPTPVIGGGVANTAFLTGGASGPNAQASLVTASFWIETVAGAAGQPDFLQLQYSQTVMLNFAGLSWPHVSVATLRKS